MDDTISRQAAIEALEREKTYCTAYRDGYAPTSPFEKYNMGLSDGIKALKNLPSAERRGKWIIQEVREYDLAYGGRIYVPEYKCSCCGHYYESYVRGDEPSMPEDADFPSFCENCGAKMEEEES